MTPEIVTGDLLNQDVDVIVNAWNRNIFPWWLLLPQGVSGAIKKKAGLKPFRELRAFGLIPLGNAVITSAGQLPYKAIIHVAGINLLWRSSERSIRDGTRNAYNIASEHGYKSIAYPIIGAGSGGFKSDAALQIMTQTLEELEPGPSAQIVIYGRKSAQQLGSSTST